MKTIGQTRIFSFDEFNRGDSSSPGKHNEYQLDEHRSIHVEGGRAIFYEWVRDARGNEHLDNYDITNTPLGESLLQA